MRFRLPTLKVCLTLAFTLLLCSCASTSVKKTWKSPANTGSPLSKLAVLAVDERGDVRRGLENRLTTQLRKQGLSVIPSYELLTLSEISQDKPAAAERLRTAGAEAVLIMRLKDLATSYREYRPAPERYAEVITGFEVGTWYDYYSVAYMDMSPTYGNLKQKVYIETSVFDLKTAKCMWSGLTQTVAGETMDRVAEADVLVAKIVAAMRKDGMLP